jgi:hypothetical protein
MKGIESTPKDSEAKRAKLPALHVRTHLRGGESLEDCQRNLKYWQDEYNASYEQAQDKFNL